MLSFTEVPQHEARQHAHWLTDAVWGSPGGLRYRHRHIEWNDRYRVMMAWLDDEPVGMHLWLPFPWGFLRHLLVVRPDRQGRGIGSALARASWAHFGPALRADQFAAAIVDATHDASMRLGESVGYDVLGSFDLYPLTHARPVGCPVVRRATVSELECVVLPALARYRYRWNDADLRATEHNSWVYVVDGTAVAGATSADHNLTVLGLGLGRADSLAFALLPWFVSGATASSYPMVTFHYCWGDPRCLGAVWETVLADRGHGSGAVALDLRDPLTVGVRRHARRGLFGRLAGTSRWHVTGRPSSSAPSDPFLWPVENR